VVTFILELAMVAPIALILGHLEIRLITRGFAQEEKRSKKLSRLVLRYRTDLYNIMTGNSPLCTTDKRNAMRVRTKTLWTDARMKMLLV